MQLQWHLLALVAFALLPLVVFAIGVVLRLSEQERSTTERALIQEARVAANRLDREFLSSFRVLAALAESEPLLAGDLAAFRATAQRVCATQPSWTTILVLSPDGRVLLNSAGPTQAATGAERAADLASLRETVTTRQATVGALKRGPMGKLAFPVRVPVLSDGEVRYVLTAVISPEAVAHVAADPGVHPEEEARIVFDSSGVVVAQTIAKTRSDEERLGAPGPERLIERIATASEGLERDVEFHGNTVDVAFGRARTSAWSVGIVVSREAFEAPVRTSTRTVVGIGMVLFLASVSGALLFARRLSRAIRSAASAADALAHGGQEAVHSAHVAEVERLAQAIRHSGELLWARERERDELVAREQAARADAEAANRAKDEFLAMLSHELRNPLSPIVTALELLRMRGEATGREHVIIDRQVRHLVRLVDDLLDVSRFERGKIELKQELVELSTVVDTAVEMTSPLLEQRRHALEVDVPPNGLVVWGDPVRLAQVIGNLLTNAAKYTPPGGKIVLRGRSESAGIVLSITDDGHGLSPELLPKIFDLFVQGPRTSDRQLGGLGIGLTVVRSLVALHGGQVSVDSPGTGRGSTFSVTLPRAFPAPGAALTAHGRGSGAHPDAYINRPRLLVVDDNQEAAILTAEFLRSQGYAVAVAYDGPSALEEASRLRPVVAVLDIGLPVMDGHELAERMREQLGAHAPELIALTGYGQATDLARSVAAGFRYHFVKPANLKDLSAAIERLVAEAATVRSAKPASAGAPQLP